MGLNVRNDLLEAGSTIPSLLGNKEESVLFDKISSLPCSLLFFNLYEEATKNDTK